MWAWVGMIVKARVQRGILDQKLGGTQHRAQSRHVLDKTNSNVFEEISLNIAALSDSTNHVSQRGGRSEAYDSAEHNSASWQLLKST